MIIEPHQQIISALVVSNINDQFKYHMHEHDNETEVSYALHSG